MSWLRAAAIIAQIATVIKGYLSHDAGQSYRLPPLRKSATFKLDDAKTDTTRFRVEYSIVTLSDADYLVSEPALETLDQVLEMLAPAFGFDSADRSRYNNDFRNPVLTMLSSERLFMLNTTDGVDAVKRQIQPLYQCRRSGERANIECGFATPSQ